MKLEVLLSVLNLKNKNLDKMNISSSCTVINQCNKDEYSEYKNFKIYSYNEKGISLSRNRALENASGDILLFCDDDMKYVNNYESIVLDAFKNNPKADMIFFNIEMSDRCFKSNKKNKRIHFFNCMRYGTVNIAVRKNSLKDIKFNLLFGSINHYRSGEDTLFIIDCLKKGLKLYSSTDCIGTVNNVKSSWFEGYNEKYFFDKGALFCAISRPMRHFLCLQYLLRYRYVYKKTGFIKAYNIMLNGANSYLKMKEND